MRARRIAALGLLPLAAACWMERPNLQSTGGGYPEDAGAATSGDGGDHGPSANVEPEEPAVASPPAEAAPAGS